MTHCHVEKALFVVVAEVEVESRSIAVVDQVELFHIGSRADRDDLRLKPNFVNSLLNSVGSSSIKGED